MSHILNFYYICDIIFINNSTYDKLMLSRYLFVIGLIKLPPSEAKVKVTFPKKPILLLYISSFRCHCQGAADAVCVSNIVVASAVHIIFFFIISSFHFGHENTDILEFHSSNMSASFSKHSTKNLAPNLNPFINV